jgi:hypothetical protein
MLEEEFRRVYCDLGFISAQGNSAPLYSCCNNSGSCWVGAKHRYPPVEIASISSPWVGPRYKELRLLVLGINFNEAGGEGGTRELIEGARAELRQSRWKHFRNEKYRGTSFYSVAGCYAAAFTEAAHLAKSTVTDDGLPSLADIDQAFDFVAYTIHVKCQPTGANGTPTANMWENCGHNVLRREIEILEPEVVLVLGTSNNKWYFDQRVLDTPAALWTRGTNVLCADGKIGSRSVKVFAVPHPRRGRVGATFQEIRTLVRAG